MINLVQKQSEPHLYKKVLDMQPIIEVRTQYHYYQIESGKHRQCTLMIATSSIGSSLVLFVIIPRAFLKEICIAVSSSLEHSRAVELAEQQLLLRLFLILQNHSPLKNSQPLYGPSEPIVLRWLSEDNEKSKHE